MTIHCLIIEPDQNNQIEYKLLFHGLTGMFQQTLVTDIQSAIKTLELSNFPIIICAPLDMGQQIEQLHLFMTETHYNARIFVVCSNSFHKNKSLAYHSVFSELIKRPLTPPKLAGKILVALKNKFYQGTMTGLHLTTVIQLIELDNLTCTLHLSMADYNDEGFIFFNNGTPVDAQYGNLQTDMALRRIFLLKHTNITMYSICPVSEHRLQTNCSKIILDYSKEQPEATFTAKNSIKPCITGVANLFLKVKKANTETRPKLLSS